MKYANLNRVKSNPTHMLLLSNSFKLIPSSTVFAKPKWQVYIDNSRQFQSFQYRINSHSPVHERNQPTRPLKIPRSYAWAVSIGWPSSIHCLLRSRMNMKDRPSHLVWSWRYLMDIFRLCWPTIHFLHSDVLVILSPLYQLAYSYHRDSVHHPGLPCWRMLSQHSHRNWVVHSP